MAVRAALLLVTFLASTLSLPNPLFGHFLWLVRSPDENGVMIKIAFSEAGELEGADLLSDKPVPELWQLDSGSRLHLKIESHEPALRARALFPDRPVKCVYTYGLFDRGEAPMLLKYYAATRPGIAADGDGWGKEESSMPMEILPFKCELGIGCEVRWKNKPLANAEVVSLGGPSEQKLTTDESGRVYLPEGHTESIIVRAKFKERDPGQLQGIQYEHVLHFATLTCSSQTETREDEATPQQVNSTTGLPRLPLSLTSFGATRLDNAIYLYGGHYGEAHQYARETQHAELLRLPLTDAREWQSISVDVGLQGLSLVSDGNSLYRIGGFRALNDEGEAAQLRSQSDFSRFDLETQAWISLPDLPEPRSSFDAVIDNSTVWVVGGWELGPDDRRSWSQTLLAFDLNSPGQGWRVVSKPPFQRRAIAVAMLKGQLYVMGGMQREGGPTTQVDIFDLESEDWRSGPALPGEPISGFGCAAAVLGDRLYVSTVEGELFRLTSDGTAWESCAALQVGRFFHRMLPLTESSLILIGGANMEIGRFDDVEIVKISSERP